MSEFITLIDNEKEYSLVEIKKILGDVYKNAYKKDTKVKKAKAKKSSDDEENPKEKKAPTAYNIFVKENMSAVKEKYPELNNQERMSKIGELWAIKKEENKEAVAEEIQEVAEEIQEVAEEIQEVAEEIQEVAEEIQEEEPKKTKKGGKKGKKAVEANENLEEN
jgi:predicted hydrocarbon binding protein